MRKMTLRFTSRAQQDFSPRTYSPCCRHWLGSLTLTAALVACPGLAQAQKSAAPNPPALGADQHSGAPIAQRTGVSITGSMGITETVDEIMARQRSYDAQPQQARAPRETKPEHEFRRPQRPNSNAPAVSQWPAGEGSVFVPRRPFNPQTVGTNFLAITLGETPGFIPPDTIAAVGPTQIMAVVNGRLKVFDKAGNLAMCSGTPCLNVDMDTFWNSVRNGSGMSDQHVRYDRLSQRWFVIGINVAFTNNRITLAVSSGPTITSSSSFSFFQFVQGTNNFADYPTLGVDANAVYIGTNIFMNLSSTAPFLGTDGYVVQKSSVTGGGPIVVTAFHRMGTDTAGISTPQGVDNDDPNSTEGYFIGDDAALFSKLNICRVSTPGATPTLDCSLSLTVPTTVDVIGVPALGTSTTLDALDTRLFAAAIHKNKNTGVSSLWTAHNFEVNSNGVGTVGGGRDGSRWYEITNMTGTPTLNQSGTLFDPAATNPIFYWIPSVAMSGQGHMAIGTSGTQATTFTGISVAGRLFSDPLGTTEAPTVAQNGVAAYNITVTNPQRWGDYSQTVVDPTDDMTIWTVQEYANATNSWGTRVIKLIAPPPATPSSSLPASVGPGQSSVNVTITGTSSGGSGFFDPGPDTGGPGYPNHISATVSGGVNVTNISYADSTHVTLTLDTRAAPKGVKTVTITNPDGQSDAGAVLTVGFATTTAVISSLNPSTFTNSVTFTATLTPVGTSAVPTGTVTFMNGGTNLGFAVASGGTATFTTNALTIGTHSITAVYSGDSSFFGSTSPALMQTVNGTAGGQADISVALTHAPANPVISFGAKLTATITVTNNDSTNPSQVALNLNSLAGLVEIDSVTPPGGAACGLPAATLQCNIASLAPNTNAVFTISLRPLVSDVRNLNLLATVAGANDPNPANDTATDTIAVRFKPFRN